MATKSTSLECLRCGGRMSEGFLLDEGVGSSRRITAWVGGEPQFNWLGITKLGEKPQMRVEAHRCRKCGWLDLFAPTRQW